jgi:hypothetical protein
VRLLPMASGSMPGPLRMLSWSRSEFMSPTTLGQYLGSSRILNWAVTRKPGRPNRFFLGNIQQIPKGISNDIWDGIRR